MFLLTRYLSNESEFSSMTFLLDTQNDNLMSVSDMCASQVVYSSASAMGITCNLEAEYASDLQPSELSQCILILHFFHLCIIITLLFFHEGMRKSSN